MQFGLCPCQHDADFDETAAQSRLAEELGYHSLWALELHGKPLCFPQPLLTLAGLARITSRVRLGTGVLLLPLHHPLEAAEAGAMVDVMSGGRLILGVGIGYRPKDFLDAGVPWERRGRRFEEALRLLVRLWTEDTVGHPGPLFPMEGASTYPRPLQSPRPPLWVAGWAEPAVRRAARLGDAWLPGMTASLDRLGACKSLYREERSRLGLPAEPAEAPLMRDVFVAAGDSEAWRRGGRAMALWHVNQYRRAGHPNLMEEDAGGGRDDDSLRRLARGRILFGEPARVADQILEYVDRIGVGHLICRMHLPGIESAAARESMTLFAERVMPRLAS